MDKSRFRYCTDGSVRSRTTWGSVQFVIWILKLKISRRRRGNSVRGWDLKMVSRVHWKKLRGSNYRGVESCEVKSCVVKSCVVKSCEVKSSGVKSCEVKQFQGEEWNRKDVFGYTNDEKHRDIICTILILLLLQIEHDHHINIPIFFIPFHIIDWSIISYHIMSGDIILRYIIFSSFKLLHNIYSYNIPSYRISIFYTNHLLFFVGNLFW